MDRLSHGLHNTDVDENSILNRTPKIVAIYVMANFSPFHISVPVMAFGAAMPDQTYYKPILFSEKTGIVEGQDAFSIKVDHDLESLDEADIIVIPYWPDPEQQISSSLKTSLNKEARKNKTILGLCLGTYVLAFSGLLKGKKAATHWPMKNSLPNSFLIRKSILMPFMLKMVTSLHPPVLRQGLIVVFTLFAKIMVALLPIMLRV